MRIAALRHFSKHLSTRHNGLWREGPQRNSNGRGRGHSLVEALTDASRYSSVASILGTAHQRQPGLLDDGRMLTTVLTQLGRRQKGSVVLSVCRWMAESRISMNRFHYAAAISAMEKSRRWEEALRLLEEAKRTLQQPDAHVYNAAISAVGACGQWERALQLLEEMRAGSQRRRPAHRASSEGGHLLRPDRISFNAAIHALASGGQWRRALELLRDMEAVDGVRPDLISYNSAMSAMASAQQWRGALMLLEEMEGRGIHPDAFSYTAAIRALSGAGEWAQALRLFDAARARVVPNTVLYSAAISAAEKGRRWEAALRLFDEMKTAGLMPNTITHNALLSALGAGGRWREALNLLRRMEARGPAPDICSYNAAMQAAVAASELDAGLSLLRRVQADPELCPDSYAAHNMLLEGCRLAGRLDDVGRAKAIKEDIRRLRLAPADAVASAVVNGQERTFRNGAPRNQPKLNAAVDELYARVRAETACALPSIELGCLLTAAPVMCMCRMTCACTCTCV